MRSGQGRVVAGAELCSGAMSQRALLVALLVAVLALGGIALLMAPGGGGNAGGPAEAGGVRRLAIGEPVFPDGLASVRAIRPMGAGGRGELVLQADPARPGEWQVERAGTPPTRWPVTPGRVAAAMRLLSEARAVVATPPEATEPTGVDGDGGEGRREVRMDLPEGTLVLRFAARPLGGAVLVAVRHPKRPEQVTLAQVQPDVADLLTAESVLAWRDDRMLPDALASTRLRLVSPSGSVAMGRAGGRWNLVEPATAPADEGVVGRVLGVLGGVRITRFADGGVPEAAQGVLAQSDTRMLLTMPGGVVGGASGGVSGAEPVEVQVRIGGPADASGRNVFAEIERPGSEPFAVVIDASSLTQLSTDATRYLFAHATAVPKADIGQITLTVAGGGGTLRWSRGVEGWSLTREGGRGTLLDRLGGAEVEDVVTFLTSTRASRLSLTALDDTGEKAAVGTLALASPGGQPLAELRLLNWPGAKLTVQSEGAFRGFGQLPALLERHLAAVLPPLPAAGEPAGTDAGGAAGGGPDMNK